MRLFRTPMLAPVAFGHWSSSEVDRDLSQLCLEVPLVGPLSREAPRRPSIDPGGTKSARRRGPRILIAKLDPTALAESERWAPPVVAPRRIRIPKATDTATVLVLARQRKTPHVHRSEERNTTAVVIRDRGAFGAGAAVFPGGARQSRKPASGAHYFPQPTNGPALSEMEECRSCRVGRTVATSSPKGFTWSVSTRFTGRARSLSSGSAMRSGRR